jgi:hypothetical protein
LTVAAWPSAHNKCWMRKPDIQGLYSNILVICAMQVSALVEWSCILHPVARRRLQVFGVPALTL